MTCASGVNVHRLGLTDAQCAAIFVQWLKIVQEVFPCSVADEKIRARLLDEMAEARGQ